MNYLLDTNIIIDHLNEKKHIKDFLCLVAESQEQLSYCIINLIEVYAGVSELDEKEKTDLLFSQLMYVELNKEIGIEASNYLKKYSLSYSLKIGDAIIAAVAKIYSLILITQNIKHFPMNDIETINPKNSRIFLALDKFL